MVVMTAESVTVPDTIALCTSMWLRWYVLCYMRFTTIKKLIFVPWRVMAVRKLCVCVRSAPKNPFSLDLGWFFTHSRNQNKLHLSCFVNNLSVNKSVWEKKLIIQRNLFICHKASRRESLVTFPFILPKEYFLFPFHFFSFFPTCGGKESHALKAEVWECWWPSSWNRA